jgi:hypothetical protein
MALFAVVLNVSSLVLLVSTVPRSRVNEKDDEEVPLRSLPESVTK